MLNKQELLSIPEIRLYIDNLTKHISQDKRFYHEYEIEHKAWKAKSGNTWSCTDLLNAKNNYWWHGNFNENKTQLDKLSKGIQASIENNDENKALYFSLRILEWGDVYKGSVKYILDAYEKKSLCSIIKSATGILDGNEYNIERFNQQDLRMDSGLTKIYSLASSFSVIYDSRVAAALTLLAYRSFSGNQIKEISKLNIFSRSQSVGKNDKRGNIKGNKTFGKKLNPGNQAHFNLVTNWILCEAIDQAIIANEKEVFKRWSVVSKNDLLRNVEAALFMIGSDISGG